MSVIEALGNAASLLDALGLLGITQAFCVVMVAVVLVRFLFNRS
jgi:hypothetical protein